MTTHCNAHPSTMLNRLIALLLPLCLALAAHAAEVVTPDSIVSFTVPDEFTTFSSDEIKQKWPTSASPPSFAVGNPKRSTSIAYDLKANPLRAENLDQALKAFEAVFSRIVPGIVWKRREMVELAGRKWVMMELTSNAIDSDIYNIMLITSFRGRMLTLNFNSTKRDFEQMEPALRRSVASLKVNDG
ncbi:MAG: hypothetical protein LCI02_28260 [Proteobacteria bacterium]|nr:hypothetical protein [Pseudomonadota bacterium]